MRYTASITGRIPFGFTGTNWEVEARAGEDTLYPVAISVPPVPGPTTVRALSREEAEALRDALTEALEFDPTPYVRVKFSGTASYTYRDPSGTLAVGDTVQVPYGYRNTLKMGTVASLGRGGYLGPTKDVAARFVVEPLTA